MRLGFVVSLRGVQNCRNPQRCRAKWMRFRMSAFQASRNGQINSRTAQKMYAVQQKQGDETRACVGKSDVGFGAQVSEKQRKHFWKT